MAKGRRSIRILVAANLWPSASNEALGSFVAARVAALRAAGATVDVVAIQESTVHRRVRRKYLDLAIRVAAAGAQAAVRGRRYDVVEAHISYPTGWLAYPVARIHRARLTLFVHGADVMEIPSRSALHHLAARLLFRRADLIVANSHFIAGQIPSRVSARPERIVVWSPGVDLQLFTAPAGGDRAGIVFAGRLDPEKGLDVLLDALAALRRRTGRQERLTVLGDGVARALLEAQVAALSLDATFMGIVPQSRVAEAMQTALVVAVPSRYQEPLGLVAIEGLAAGAVVVASDVGGLPEVVGRTVRGLVVEPSHPEALATALETALERSRDEMAPADRDVLAGLLDEHSLDRVVRMSLTSYASRR